MGQQALLGGVKAALDPLVKRPMVLTLCPIAIAVANAAPPNLPATCAPESQAALVAVGKCSDVPCGGPVR